MESEKAQSLVGLRAKLYHKKRHHKKIQIKKQIKAQEKRNVKSSTPTEPSSTPLPQYLLDRSNPTNTKALSSASTSNSSSPIARIGVRLLTSKRTSGMKRQPNSLCLCQKLGVLPKKKCSRSLRPGRRLRRRMGISISCFLRH